MIIKRVILKNFKCHVDRIFEFKLGINVIVGKNGTGKSSIFEALGIALLGIYDKDLKSLVTRNTGAFAKDFTIVVEFEGNDGIEYVVERKFSPSRHVLRLKGSNNVVSDSTKDVPRYVSNLAGLGDGNFEDLFKNVICAYQNDIVSIFEKPTEDSKRFFNRIFGVEFYDELYKRFSDVEKVYGVNIRLVEERIRLLDSELEKLKDVEEHLERIYTDMRIHIQEKEKSVERIDSLILRKRNLEEQVVHLKEMIYEMNLLSKDLENAKKILDDVSKQIKESEIAREILRQNVQGYEKYLRLEEEVKKLRVDEKKLQGALNEKLSLGNEIGSLEVKIKEMDATSKEKKEQLDRIEKKLAEIEDRIKDTNLKLENKREELKKVQSDLQNISTKKLHIEWIYDEYSKTTIEKERLIEELSLEDNYALYDKLKKEIGIFGQEIAKLNSVTSKEQELISEISKYESELKNLENAKSQLSSGICPILNEACKNLQSIDPLTKLNEKLEQLRIVVVNKKQEKIQIDMAKEEKEEIEKQLNDKKITLAKVEQKIAEEKRKRERLSTLKKILESMKNDYGDVQLLRENIDKEFQYLIKLESSLKSDLKNLNASFDELKKQLIELRMQYENTTDNIQKINEDKEKIRKELERLCEKVSEYKDVDVELEKVRLQISESEKEMEYYRPMYEKYNLNKNIAGKYQELLEKQNTLKLSVSEINGKVRRKSDEISKFPVLEMLESEKMNLESEIESEKKKLKEVEVELGRLSEALKHGQDRKKQRNERVAEKKEREKEKLIYEKKLEMTKQFREKLKTMGVEVTKRLTQSISTEATEHYRKITGKFEEIIIDHSNQKYIFKIVDPVKGERLFNELSGGEQVSAGISLRIAIANILTDANMYILDEPTVNLDDERRALLAENLKVLLSNLKQAFIVTHDEVFIGKGYYEVRL
ncbi:MAG: AAA family ATPase [Fervidobacterium sp.]